MEISPDAFIYWQSGAIKLNATIVATWVNILVLAGVAALITSRLTTGERMSRSQNLLEVLVRGMERAIAAKTVTYDFARLMDDATELSCSGFGEALIAGM